MNIYILPLIYFLTNFFFYKKINIKSKKIDKKKFKKKLSLQKIRKNIFFRKKIRDLSCHIHRNKGYLMLFSRTLNF